MLSGHLIIDNMNVTLNNNRWFVTLSNALLDSISGFYCMWHLNTVVSQQTYGIYIDDTTSVDHKLAIDIFHIIWAHYVLYYGY